MVGLGLDHIDPNTAKANVANLKTWTRKVHDFADKEKAHYGEAPSRLAEDQTIGDLHHAVDVIVDMAVRYRELILGSSMDKRVGLLPWTQIFRVPWVPADQMAHVNRTISDLEAKRARGEPLTDEDFR
ncbi:MAG: hypothetical protein M3P43_05690 [Actinomycetota bacterium]|nr:hypothetical protein [Actinomycetota bacterium]